jgi:hypothetical protein
MRGDKGRFGPNSDAVEAFVERLGRLTDSEADAVRRRFLSRGDDSIEQVGLEHARVVGRVIRAAVRAGLRDEHTAAERAAVAAITRSGVVAAGIQVYAADLAGALVVRDAIDLVDLDFLASPWQTPSAASP